MRSIRRDRRFQVVLFALCALLWCAGCDKKEGEDAGATNAATNAADSATNAATNAADNATNAATNAADPATNAATTADPAPAEAQEYLRFKIAHHEEGKDDVLGTFSFTLTRAQVNFENLLDESNFVEFTVDLASISTGVEARDAHLKTPDFFDVARFATATVTIKGVQAAEGDDSFTATATIDLHGFQKEVPVAFKVVDKSADAVTIEGSATVNRLLFEVGAAPAEANAAESATVEVRLRVANKE